MDLKKRAAMALKLRGMTQMGRKAAPKIPARQALKLGGKMIKEANPFKRA